jgi:uroporphyrinogen-III synthase
VKELVSRGEAQGARVLCPVPLVLEPLKEPPVVPRFIDALVAAGAQPTRVPAYVTGLGCREEDARAERGLLEDGAVHAIAFSSTAEVGGSGECSWRMLCRSKDMSHATSSPVQVPRHIIHHDIC